MRSYLTLSFSTFLLLIGYSTARAGKIPIPSEGLKNASKLIVVGEVEAYHKEVNENPDGSKTAYITLDVTVDQVEKGTAKIGEPITVRCWRVVKEPTNGELWDLGNDYIPAPGSRARFYLERNVGGIWMAQWPNGIEPIKGAAPLNLPLEHASAVPPSKTMPKYFGMAWPFVVGIGIAAVGLVILIIFFVTRRATARRPVEAPGPR